MVRILPIPKISLLLALVLCLALNSGCSNKWPDRPSADLRAYIGSARAIPSDCRLVQRDRRAEIQQIEKLVNESGRYNWTQSYRNVTQYAILAEAEATRNDVNSAVAILDRAIASTANFRQLITLYASKGLMLTAIGAKSDAIESFGLSNALIGDTRRNQDQYRFYAHLARGFTAAVNGENSTAETSLRRALALVNDTFFYRRLDETVDLNFIRSTLVYVLIRKEKLGDAELVAREAILRKRHFLEAKQYSASTAQLWNSLADVYFEMERFNDAQFAINVSVNMLEHDCAHPQSIVFQKARAIASRIDGRRSKMS